MLFKYRLYKKSKVLKYFILILLAYSSCFSQESSDPLHDAKDDYLTTPIWAVELENDINWMTYAGDNRLLLCCKEELKCMESSTGNTLWVLPDSSKRIKENLFILSDSINGVYLTRNETEIDKFYGHKNSLRLINLNSGDIYFKSIDLEIADIDGYFYLPTTESILIFCKMLDKSKTVFNICAKSGDVLWENPELYITTDPKLIKLESGFRLVNGNQPPIIDSDSTVIFCLNEHYISKWNIKTGKLIWNTRLYTYKNPAYAKNYPLAQLNHDSSIVFIAGHKHIMALYTTDGEGIWEEWPKVKGDIRQFEFHDDKIIARGEYLLGGKSPKHFFSAISLESGKKTWEKVFHKEFNKTVTNYIIGGDSVFFCMDNKLLSFNLSDGKFSNNEIKIKFKDLEKAEYLDTLENDWFVASPQNIMRLKKTGEVVYQEHHPVIRTSDWIIVLQSVISIASLYLQIAYRPCNDNYIIRIFTPNVHYNSTTRFGDNDIYMLGKYKNQLDKRKHGIAKTDKTTGEIISKVFFNEKYSIYEPDATNNRVFVAYEKRLSCYDL